LGKSKLIQPLVKSGFIVIAFQITRGVVKLVLLTERFASQFQGSLPRLASKINAGGEAQAFDGGEARRAKE
jgi:hypothetical protein